VIQPANKVKRVKVWPKIQIFCVFDGHGGHKCAEYLKDTFHNSIINQPQFPENIKEAINQAAYQTEK
jgi:serine/threonine protein phosphatase PrpC